MRLATCNMYTVIVLAMIKSTVSGYRVLMNKRYHEICNQYSISILKTILQLLIDYIYKYEYTMHIQKYCTKVIYVILCHTYPPPITAIS